MGEGEMERGHGRDYRGQHLGDREENIHGGQNRQHMEETEKNSTWERQKITYMKET
jgi:hypothetical protein